MKTKEEKKAKKSKKEKLEKPVEKTSRAGVDSKEEFDKVSAFQKKLRVAMKPLQDLLGEDDDYQGFLMIGCGAVPVVQFVKGMGGDLTYLMNKAMLQNPEFAEVVSSAILMEFVSNGRKTQRKDVIEEILEKILSHQPDDKVNPMKK